MIPALKQANGNFKVKRFSVGFTLIELMIVVSILVILAAVATPSLKNMINYQRVKSASYELFSSLVVARSEAVKRNGNVTLTAVSGGWQNGWQITAADGSIIKNHGALTSLNVSVAPTSIIYKRTGRLSATASPSFQIDINPADTNFTRCISIELSGLPRTKKGSCS